MRLIFVIAEMLLVISTLVRSIPTMVFAIITLFIAVVSNNAGAFGRSTALSQSRRIVCRTTTGGPSHFFGVIAGTAGSSNGRPPLGEKKEHAFD
ncbi:hypothetical protein IB75_04785 [Nitrosococcus oceani C-27]|uniref:Uncharacterized protein n=1 Tax=Nitrosococcus oceani C-27 TaxID=314279 RepID=A0A0E2Z8Y1_9GAMM|nr:hypothetical protein IB75_04785 [Nitrosococcus oceani C-27]